MNVIEISPALFLEILLSAMKQAWKPIVVTSPFDAWLPVYANIEIEFSDGSTISVNEYEQESFRTILVRNPYGYIYAKFTSQKE